MDKKEKMFSLVEQYRISGLTMKAFTSQQGIKLPTFLYWVKKKKEAEMEPARGGFLQVDLPVRKFMSEPVEILYPNGVRVFLNHPNTEQLRECINLLGC